MLTNAIPKEDEINTQVSVTTRNVTAHEVDSMIHLKIKKDEKTPKRWKKDEKKYEKNWEKKHEKEKKEKKKMKKNKIITRVKNLP